MHRCRVSQLRCSCSARSMTHSRAHHDRIMREAIDRVGTASSGSRSSGSSRPTSAARMVARPSTSFAGPRPVRDVLQTQLSVLEHNKTQDNTTQHTTHTTPSATMQSTRSSFSAARPGTGLVRAGSQTDIREASEHSSNLTYEAGGVPIVGSLVSTLRHRKRESHVSLFCCT